MKWFKRKIKNEVLDLSQERIEALTKLEAKGNFKDSDMNKISDEEIQELKIKLEGYYYELV